MIWAISNCFDFYLLIGKTDVKSKITIKNEAVPQNAPVKEVSLCQVIVFSIVMGSGKWNLDNWLTFIICLGKSWHLETAEYTLSVTHTGNLEMWSMVWSTGTRYYFSLIHSVEREMGENLLISGWEETVFHFGANLF